MHYCTCSSLMYVKVVDLTKSRKEVFSAFVACTGYPSHILKNFLAIQLRRDFMDGFPSCMHQRNTILQKPH